MKNLVALLLLIFGLCLALTDGNEEAKLEQANALAQTQDAINNRPKESLRGLQSVRLVISKLPRGDEQGPTVAQLQADIERRLRNAGIVLLAEAEAMNTPGRPTFLVELSVNGRPDDCTMTMYVQMREAVSLARDGSITVMATTWQDNSLARFRGSNPPDVVAKMLLDNIGRMVDRFIEDCKAANR